MAWALLIGSWGWREGFLIFAGTKWKVGKFKDYIAAWGFLAI